LRTVTVRPAAPARDAQLHAHRGTAVASEVHAHAARRTEDLDAGHHSFIVHSPAAGTCSPSSEVMPFPALAPWTHGRFGLLLVPFFLTTVHRYGKAPAAHAAADRIAERRSAMPTSG